MKKLLLLSISIILSNCELSTQKSIAYHKMVDFDGGNASPSNIYYDYNIKCGMTYLVASNYSGGLISINLTKDSLEVELLKLQIQKITK